MWRIPLVLLALVASCAGAGAAPFTPLLTLDGISNSTTGTVTWVSNGQASTETVYISQFQMTYQPTSSPSSQQTIYTFCVDLNHDESLNSPYAVTPASLTSTFSATNSNEMGYLYSRYGTKSLQGNALLDASMQLALWDLSITPTGSTANQLTPGQPSSGFYGDANFGVKDIGGGLTTSAVVTETNALLGEAFNQVKNGYTVGDSVVLLQNDPPPGPEQAVLIDSPEPSAVILSAISFMALGCCRMARRFAGTPSPV
jgi:hypothetical protein